MIQTYEPGNYALKEAAAHDYDDFFDQEIKLRKFMDYPPFTDLIMVNFTSEEAEKAFECADRAADYLRRAMDGLHGGKILGPKRSLSFKSKDSVRAYFLIKCPKGERNQYIFHLENFNKKIINEGFKCNIDIDVNPYSAY